MPSTNGGRSPFRRPIFILSIVALFGLWLFTGGIAIQRVERFHSVEESRIEPDEQINVSLHGEISSFEIPFLISNHREVGPFRLEVGYNNYGPNPPKQVRLRSVRLTWEGSDPVTLLSENQPITLPIVPKQYWNSGTSGVVSHIIHCATHTFDKPLEIPFAIGRIVKCELDIEFVFEGNVKQITVVRHLKGDKLDFISSWWNHVANC